MQNTLFSFDCPVFPEWTRRHLIFFRTRQNKDRLIIWWFGTIWFKLLPKKKVSAGTHSYLPRAGYFRLMFLKHYTGLRDEKLFAAIHINYAYEMFCVCHLKVGEEICDNASVTNKFSFNFSKITSLILLAKQIVSGLLSP